MCIHYHDTVIVIVIFKQGVRSVQAEYKLIQRVYIIYGTIDYYHTTYSQVVQILTQANLLLENDCSVRVCVSKGARASIHKVHVGNFSGNLRLGSDQQQKRRKWKTLRQLPSSISSMTNAGLFLDTAFQGCALPVPFFAWRRKGRLILAVKRYSMNYWQFYPAETDKPSLP